MNAIAKSVTKTISNRQDVYERVTAKIIDQLEQGIRPWMKPWSGDHANGKIIMPLRHCGTPYRGINVLLLWAEAIDKGYASAKWMTYRQAQELGGQVRKGEHGSLVVYANSITRTEENDKGEDVERAIPYLKGYTVFNVQQIEKLPERFYEKPVDASAGPVQLIEEAERFFAASGAVFRHGGNRAYYAPGPDVIQLPYPEAFRDAQSYAGVKAHELTHWTGAKARLDRTFGRKHGDELYAREELVAELGAAFLCGSLGIAPEVRDDHAAYLGHWLKVLKEDKRAIFSAAAHAQQAVDYLHTLQPSAG